MIGGAAYRLSVEELAAAVAQRGDAGLAVNLLNAYREEALDARAVEERLLAGGHGLLARGLASVTADNEFAIDADFAALLATMMSATVTVRFALTFADAEVAEFTYSDGARLCHLVTFYELVHELRALSPKEVVDRTWRLLGGPETSAFAATPTSIPASLLGAMTATPHAGLVPALVAEGVEERVATRLAEDCSSGITLATLLRVEPEPGAGLAADEGSVLIRGRRHLWLLTAEASTDPPRLLLSSATRTRVEAELLRLLGRGDGR